MRRIVLLLLFFLFVSTVPSLGQQKPMEKPTSTPMAPTAGPRMEFLDEVSYYEQRYERLADAIPAQKFNWHPAEGVRTVGEVYMHIVTANYSFAKMLGTLPPSGYDPKALLAESNDKAAVMHNLKDSFAHFRSAILDLKDSDLSKEVKTPRGQTTIRGAFFIITGHFGEHLGQSIAYARTLGIVPPWTEERMRQESDKSNP